jgi:Trk-type K+ transport system membrane component
MTIVFEVTLVLVVIAGAVAFGVCLRLIKERRKKE